MELQLIRPTSMAQWAKIYKLYRSAFPRSERKPFSIIRKMYRKGVTDIWCCEADGSFAGIAITINGPEHILLDYLAVSPNHRGSGVGSATLLALQKKYTDRSLFLEIESVWEDVPDREQRLRRKAFYLRNGLIPMNVMIWLFGVKMELLGVDCKLTFDEYKAFYRDNYNEWAAEHISEAEHPEAANSTI